MGNIPQASHRGTKISLKNRNYVATYIIDFSLVGGLHTYLAPTLEPHMLFCTYHSYHPAGGEFLLGGPKNFIIPNGTMPTYMYVT